MKTLVIGMGQIGTAIYDILSGHYSVHFKHKGDGAEYEDIEVAHICFPYSDEFVSEVKRYQEMYKPKYTVIHSTVPVGTSRQCNAIHSPVRGIHPNLKSGILTFTKFLGGEQASEVADYFRRANIDVYIFDKPETTELMKLESTLCYGKDIEFTKQVKRDCDKHGVPFSAWTIWVDTYNKGFGKLGHKEFTRPNLIPIMKKIGGHCVLSNCDLLKNKFSEFIKNLNRE